MRRTLDLCWLNETIRTAAATNSLAEIAPDDKVDRIDVPRRLVREMRLCGPLVGAPALGWNREGRSRHHCRRH